jgi:hypothetical protein
VEGVFETELRASSELGWVNSSQNCDLAMYSRSACVEPASYLLLYSPQSQEARYGHAAILPSYHCRRLVIAVRLVHKCQPSQFVRGGHYLALQKWL